MRNDLKTVCIKACEFAELVHDRKDDQYEAAKKFAFSRLPSLSDQEYVACIREICKILEY